jgi:hypothetical protein
MIEYLVPRMKNAIMTGSATKSMDIPHGARSGKARFISSRIAQSAIMKATRETLNAFEFARDMKYHALAVRQTGI